MVFFLARETPSLQPPKVQYEYYCLGSLLTQWTRGDPEVVNKRFSFENLERLCSAVSVDRVAGVRILARFNVLRLFGCQASIRTIMDRNSNISRLMCIHTMIQIDKQTRISTYRPGHFNIYGQFKVYGSALMYSRS